MAFGFLIPDEERAMPIPDEGRAMPVSRTRTAVVGALGGLVIFVLTAVVAPRVAPEVHPMLRGGIVAGVAAAILSTMSQRVRKP